ncbi:MAG: serine hydrolase domain-containing protein [Planctomycetaceae bacterium]
MNSGHLWDRRFVRSNDDLRWHFLIGVLIASAMMGTLGHAKQGRGEDDAPTLPQLKAFDEVMFEFRKREAFPGGALAIVKDGRLVYARGFGYGDDREQMPVRATSLFRIASISKPLTAVAVLKLSEQGRVDLNAPVLKLLDIRPVTTPASAPDPRIEQVTPLHLLQHTAGFDRSKSWDPMLGHKRVADALGTSLPITSEQLIAYTLGQPLDFDPGTRFSYSNFGYLMLGHLIEKITGEAYETYVQQEVLKPLGITSMRIGGSLLSDRADNEVMYFDTRERTGSGVVEGVIGQQVARPYGVEDMQLAAAGGGWIGSAIDVARFGSAFDGTRRCPVLKPETVRFMFMPPSHLRQKQPKLPIDYESCGWHVKLLSDNPPRFNYAKGGLMPGVSTQLVCRADGVTFAVLFNADTGQSGQHLAAAVEGPLHKAADAIRRWPSGSLQVHE